MEKKDGESKEQEWSDDQKAAYVAIKKLDSDSGGSGADQTIPFLSEKINEWVYENFFADDDSDGVVNAYDKMHGFNDAVEHYTNANGDILARASDTQNVWAIFGLDGEQRERWFTRTGVTFQETSSTWAVTVGPNGPEFSIIFGSDGISHNLTLLPDFPS